MPRKHLELSEVFPYHVTNRSNNREWFYIPLRSAWTVFTVILAKAAERYQTEIHTFVLMSNHYHLLITTPQRNIDAFMRYFQTEVCRQIQRESLRINHIFGSRYKWSLLETPEAFAYAYKYVLRNPVRAGLVERSEQYGFSTLYGMINGRTDAVPVTERCDFMANNIPRDATQRLAWINQPTAKESEELIGKALRRNRFQFSNGNDVRKRLELLRQVYGVAPATFSAEK